MTFENPTWWKINAGDDGTLKNAWLNGPVISIGWSVGDFRELTDREIVEKDSSPKSQLSKFVGATAGPVSEAMAEGDRVIAYAPQPVGEVIGVGVVGPATYVSKTTLEPPHKNFRPVAWYDSDLPVDFDKIPETLQTGQNTLVPRASLERYRGDTTIFEQPPLGVDYESVRNPPTLDSNAVTIMDVALEPGRAYSAAEIRSAFGKGRAGKGIEINYNENEKRYLRLFSSPSSEYGDDLDADPMRYVGEKDFSNPNGDQVPNRGNGALIESRDNDWPVFLFEKISESPVRHRYHGRVELVDYEHNYRPSKDKREFDFFLRRTDAGAPSTDSTPDTQTESDLVPGRLRDVDPNRQDVPESEETIEYEPSKGEQAEASNTHEQTVETLSEWLGKDGWSCHETVETDVLATRENQVLVAEVKSVNGQNDGRQIRKALGQLHENCYRDVVRRGWSDRALIACLVLSQPPADRYSGYIEYLHERGIETLWKEASGITGLPESVDRIAEESQ